MRTVQTGPNSSQSVVVCLYLGSFIIMKLKGLVRFVRVQADTSLSAWPQMEVYLNRSIWPVFLPEVKLVMNVLSIRNAGLRTLKSRADALKARELLTLNRLDRRSPAGNIFAGFSPHATGSSHLDLASGVIIPQSLCSTRQFVGFTRNTKDGLCVMRVSGPGTAEAAAVGLAGTVWSQGFALGWRIMQRDKL